MVQLTAFAGSARSCAPSASAPAPVLELTAGHLLVIIVMMVQSKESDDVGGTVTTRSVCACYELGHSPAALRSIIFLVQSL